MTIPEHLIKINDNQTINNPRELLINESPIKKAFIFKGYKTEKERIVNNLFNKCINHLSNNTL